MLIATTYSFSQRGIATTAVVIIAVVVLIGAGAAFYFSSRPTSPEAAQTPDQNIVVKEQPLVPNGTALVPASRNAPVTYSGTVLAGTSAPLLDFNQADFAAAKASDKLIVLYFYADWCPICRKEFPVLQSAFNALTSDQVLGFRVNYNDDQTDAAETALAREHGVAYQHTKVFVKNGQQVLKSPETWDQSRYLTEITRAAGQ